MKTEVFKSEKISHEKKHGGVAQLGEHLLCKQGVRSSILLISTRGYEEEGRTTTATNDYGLIAQVVRAHA